jgi:hypothetical protein
MVLTTWILAVQQHVVRWLAHAQYVRQYIHEQLGREHAVQWVAGSIGLIPALLQQPQESCIAIRRWAFRPRTNSKGGRRELQKGLRETQGNGINDGTLYPVLAIVFGHYYETITSARERSIGCISGTRTQPYAMSSCQMCRRQL